MSEIDRAGMVTPVDEKAIVTFAQDKTEAYISFSPPRDGGEPITPEKIKAVLGDFRVMCGLDSKVIEELMLGNKEYNKPYRVAVGKKPVNGKDGEIQYLFNVMEKTLSPKINEDGSVDYKNLNLVEMASKGDVLLRAIPPTAGENGIDVFGADIPASSGRAVMKLPRGKNTVVSADGSELIADVTGQILMIKDSVSMSEVLEIKGDVDNSTGNIDFNGSVVVGGSIIQGFRVTAIGNIEVKGSIGGAEVECVGNLVADKGIVGMHKANIKVGGSLYARMIQDANVDVAGDIASDGIMHCDVKCGGRIELKGKKGILVGGSVTSKKEVEASVFGSPLGTQTMVNVGLDGSVYERYKDLMNDIARIKKQYEDVSKFLLSIGKPENINNLPDFKKKSYIKSLYDAKNLQSELQVKQNEALELKTELDEFKYTGRMVSRSVVYPGVNVQIGNAVMSVRDELGKCYFLNGDGRVKISYDL